MPFRVPYRRVSALLLVAAALPAQAANTDPRKPAELPPADATFVPLQPIDVPIVDAGRIDGVLHVSIVVQARSEQDAAALTERMPELRAAALPAAIEFARLRASRFAPVDVSRLAETIAPPVRQVNAAIAKVLIVKVSAT
jgi:hypothetical protein